MMGLSDKEAKRIVDEQDDVNMIRNPELWPNWPVLPVKKYVQEESCPHTGVVLGGLLTTVFIVNMFSLGGKRVQDLIDDESIQRHKYSSIEELVADGWQVD